MKEENQNKIPWLQQNAWQVFFCYVQINFL